MAKVNFGKLEYPLGIGGDGEVTAQTTSRLVFQPYNVEPLSFASENTTEASESKANLTTALAKAQSAATSFISSITSFDMDEAREEQKKSFEEATKAQAAIEGGSLSLKEPTKIEGQAVYLYTPVSIQLDDRLEYQQGALGLSGATTLNALSRGDNVVNAAIQGITQGFRGITDLVGKISDAETARLVSARAAQGALKNVLPEGITNAVNLAAAVTINPNLRTLFKGVQMRSFNFNFKFIPTSEKEATAVRSIISFFRYYAYPEPIKGYFGYEYPELFDIQVQVNKNGSYEVVDPFFQKAYLQSISVTYNPTASIYHTDGSAVETNLSLAFVEYRTLDRDDILQENEGSSEVASANQGTKFTSTTYDPDVDVT